MIVDYEEEEIQINVEGKITFEFVDEVQIEKLTDENAFILNNSSKEDIEIFLSALQDKIISKFFPQMYYMQSDMISRAAEAQMRAQEAQEEQMRLIEQMQRDMNQ